MYDEVMIAEYQGVVVNEKKKAQTSNASRKVVQNDQKSLLSDSLSDPDVMLSVDTSALVSLKYLLAPPTHCCALFDIRHCVMVARFRNKDVGYSISLAVRISNISWW